MERQGLRQHLEQQRQERQLLERPQLRRDDRRGRPRIERAQEGRPALIVVVDVQPPIPHQHEETPRVKEEQLLQLRDRRVAIAHVLYIYSRTL